MNQKKKTHLNITNQKSEKQQSTKHRTNTEAHFQPITRRLKIISKGASTFKPSFIKKQKLKKQS